MRVANGKPLYIEARSAPLPDSHGVDRAKQKIGRSFPGRWDAAAQRAKEYHLLLDTDWAVIYSWH